MEEKEKALLVGANLNDDYYFLRSIDELKQLVEACNMQSVGRVVQNVDKINPSFYVGSGKLDEIREKIEELSPDVIVFNNELTPSQLKNLELKLKLPILDRTSIILEIFAIRAKTKEAKLQVEVAKLKYMLPRLVGLHANLGRQGGGSGVSNKGSGEKKIELDRRKIESRINKLERELKEIETIRDIQRRKRESSDIPLVSLVGYTNAGKSTIMNNIISSYGKSEEKLVYVEDMLFATLDTSLRNVKLKNNKEFLLSDTVGFIKELPHNLIKAFRSTLEEVKKADLLLHVIDVSDNDFEENIKTTNETLKQIGADKIPAIYVYNKAESVKNSLPIIQDNSIYISAKLRIGIDELLDLICNKIFSDYILCKMKIPFEEGSLISYFNDKYNIQSVEYTEDGTIIKLECSSSDYKKYYQYVI